MGTKTVKKRNWVFVLYPESAPDDWLEVLQKTGLPIAISPLHDQDVNPTGEKKKAHHHVILCYPGPTTFNVVKELSVETLGQVIPEPCDSVRGYYRYLTHRDNPEKAQYQERDIITLNGFSILDQLNKSEIGEYKKAIQSIIIGNDITEYADLMDLLLQENMAMEYDIASSNTLFFNSYIRSRRHIAEGRRK